MALESIGLDARDLMNNSLWREAMEDVLAEHGIDPTRNPPPLIGLESEELDGLLSGLNAHSKAASKL